MIGNERVSPEHKFMDLFKRVSVLEMRLSEILDQLSDIHAVKTQDRKTLTLRSGIRP
mgnify:CR=1 FL=1